MQRQLAQKGQLQVRRPARQLVLRQLNLRHQGQRRETGVLKWVAPHCNVQLATQQAVCAEHGEELRCSAFHTQQSCCTTITAAARTAHTRVNPIRSLSRSEMGPCRPSPQRSSLRHRVHQTAQAQGLYQHGVGYSMRHSTSRGSCAAHTRSQEPLL